jgi:hypothetical protein
VHLLPDKIYDFFGQPPAEGKGNGHSPLNPACATLRRQRSGSLGVSGGEYPATKATEFKQVDKVCKGLLLLSYVIVRGGL